MIILIYHFMDNFILIIARNEIDKCNKIPFLYITKINLIFDWVRAIRDTGEYFETMDEKQFFC